MTTILGLVYSLSVASLPVPAAACAIDGPTGLSIPRMARGACVSAQADRSLFVQRSDEGLLVAEMAAGGARDVEIDGAAPRVVFCPSATLDFATGAPTTDCLSTTSPLEPGPKALVGAGTVRASLSAGCASAARVIATVTSASGDRFDLIGSLASLDGTACAALYDRIELSYAGASRAELPGEGRPPSDRRERIEQLMRLDDEQFRAVEMMLSLTPRDWEIVREIVEGGAGTGAGSSGLPKDRIDPHPIEAEGIPELIDTILARVNAIRTNVNSLLNRVPDRGDVRSLLSQIDLAPLRDMIGEVRDSVQGLLDIARELREGFDTFDAAAFRTRLGTVLSDLERASTLYQRMLCFEDPDVTIRQISMTPLRRLIDRAPPIVLYALSRILDTVDASWDQRIAGVIDAVPVEVTELCNDGSARASTRRPDLISTGCNVVRRKTVGGGLGVAKATVGVALLRFRFVKNHTTEDLSLTIGAVAAAGATTGTAKKNPAHEAAEGMVEKLENIKDFLETLTDYRKDCLDRDHDVEEALLDCAKEDCGCTVPLSVLLQGAVVPSYKYVSDLVDARIVQAESSGVGDTESARDWYTLAIDPAADETAGGYASLCEAYKALQTRTDGAPSIAPSSPRGKLPPARAKTRKN